MQAHGTAIKSELEETAQDRKPKQPWTANGSPSPLQGRNHPLPGAPAHMEAAESVTASLTSGACEAPHPQQQYCPGPEASAPAGALKLRSAADGNAGGAFQERGLLKQEPEARESTLPKGSCKAGEQRGGGASSGLSSLPSIANLPRISSQYLEPQVECLTLPCTPFWAQLHHWIVRIHSMYM